MRAFCLVLCLLLPQLLRAQFNSFEPGSYILKLSPSTRQQALLKLRSRNQLLVKGTDGKKVKLKPEDVSSFRIGAQKYTTASNFDVDQGLGGFGVEDAFVEQLDSGRIVLLRMDYVEGGGAPMMGAGGMGMGGGGSSTYSIFLLRRAGNASVYPIPANRLTGAGQKFRDALSPFLTERQDLSKLLTDKKLSIDNLPDIVRALNSGKPY